MLPATLASAGGHVPPGAGHAGRRADLRQQLGDRARLAVGHHQRLAVHHGRAVQRGDQRVDGVADVGAVDQRRARADDRQPAGPGPLHDPPDQLGVPRPPDQVRADGEHRPARSLSAAEGELLGERPCCGRTARGRRSGRPHRRGAPTSEAPRVGDRRRRDVHQPGDAGGPAGLDHGAGARDVGPLVVRPRPGDVDLGGQVDDRVLPGDRAPRPRRVGDVGEHLGQAQPGRPALQHRDLVAPRGQRPGGRRRRASRWPR